MMRRSLASVLVLPALLSVASCSRLQHHFFGHTTTRHGTLTIDPAIGPAGTAFTLNAGGFRPGEAMTFEVDVPNHPRFVGPSHTAGADGKVMSTYTPLAGDPTGDYPVKAVGNRGTQATAHLTVVAH